MPPALSEPPSPLAGATGGYPTENAGRWPKLVWPRAAASSEFATLFDEAFDDTGPLATTRAALVIEAGAIVLERYADALPSFVGPATPVEASTPLHSWSMAKSHLAVLFAACHAQGLVDLKDPAPVPEWSSPGDPRGAITFEHLIEMRDGLDFVEEYTDEDRSDVLEMLYGAGQADCARYAALRPARHEPGTRFNYSSGTSNILSRALGEVLGGPEAMRVALASCLFEPVSMRSAQPGFDEAGTWVASTNLHAVAHDYARFGLMLCRGGVAGGRRVVPQAWVDRWRTPRSQDDQGRWYSAHFWVMGDRFGTFYASGYEGQSITVCPPLDLVIVRLGSTPQSRKGALVDWRCRLIDQVATELGHAPSS